MVAVAESGVKTLKAVETKMRSHLHGISPIDDLKFKSSTIDKLKDAFAELETFSVQFRSYAMRKNRPDGTSSVPRARKGLTDFAPTLSNVTDFGVSFDLADQNGAMCRSLTSALDLSKLKKVKLDSIAIEGKFLGTILTGLTSVTKLTLHAIDLVSGNWVTILKILKQSPELQHLHLVYLQQSRQKVYFLKQLDEEESTNEWGPMPPMPGDVDDDDDDDDDDDWSEEHGDDGDEELPDLIPQEELNSSMPLSVKLESAEEQPVPAAGSDVVKKCALYEDKDYKAPGQERMPERGYFICLPSRDEIEKQLPLFIEECNVGQDIMDDDMVGLGGLNGLLAALGGPAGGPGPIVLPVPVGPLPPTGQGQPPPQPAGGHLAPGGPGGQGAGNALTAALNQILAGGPPAHGHNHMHFTIPMPNINAAAIPPPNVLPLPGVTNVPGLHNPMPPAPPAAAAQAAPGAANTNATLPAAGVAAAVNDYSLDDEDWANEVD
jgi:hypothetical protein